MPYQSLPMPLYLLHIQRYSQDTRHDDIPVPFRRDEPGSNIDIIGIEKEFVGRHGGFSFKIIKGVYYRTGQSKGHPIEHSYMDMVGIGQLIITNQNIFFYSQTKSVKIPLKKIIGIVPYSDGVEIQKDGTNSRRMVFQGFDCWFIMNLISQINI